MIESQETPQTILASSSTAETPQFAKAEYANPPGTDRCGLCGSALSGEYYRVNNQLACATCAGQASAGQPTASPVAYARAALFGFGGALAGLALFSSVDFVTTMTIGYRARAGGGRGAGAGGAGAGGSGGT